METLKKPKTPPKNPSQLNFSSAKKVEEKPMSNEIKTPRNKVTEAKPVFEKTVKPRNNKIAYITLSIILIAILIAVSTTMIVIFPTAKRANDIRIDFQTISQFEPISIYPEGDGTQREYAMPGDTVNCKFKIESKKDPSFTDDVNLDVFIRFKITLNMDSNYITALDEKNGATVEMDFVNNFWIRGIDGYYYLTKTANSDGVLSPGETLEILRSFKLSTEIGNEYAGKEVGITFEAEALQANYQAIKELWPTAPYQWAIQFKDLI